MTTQEMVLIASVLGSAHFGALLRWSYAFSEPRTAVPDAKCQTILTTRAPLQEAAAVDTQNGSRRERRRVRHQVQHAMSHF